MYAARAAMRDERAMPAIMSAPANADWQRKIWPTDTSAACSTHPASIACSDDGTAGATR